MCTEDGRIWITYNGELYNYQAIRKRLQQKGYRFLTHSDTEVLLLLYRDLGPRMVNELRGMYAFAIWDQDEASLLLARDPFGIKPLYYADNGRTIRAASQVKTLLAAGGTRGSPEAAGHVGFFLLGCVPEPFTLHKEIRALPPGATLWVSNADGTPRVKIHCDVQRLILDGIEHAACDDPPDEDQARDRLCHALRDTVRHHMVSDVPVGVFLSAGLDSTSIAATATDFSGDSLRTLTLGFSEFRNTRNDEASVAQKIAQGIGSQHQTRWLEAADLRKEIDHIFSVMD